MSRTATPVPGTRPILAQARRPRKYRLNNFHPPDSTREIFVVQLIQFSILFMRCRNLYGPDQTHAWLVTYLPAIRTVFPSSRKAWSSYGGLAHCTRPMSSYHVSKWPAQFSSLIEPEKQSALDLLDKQRRKHTPSPGAPFTPSRDGMLGWLGKLGHPV
jgi:hypothetical protein